MKFYQDTFDYHISWKSKGHHPGQHKSAQRGMGIEFAGHATLLDYPDPRRIDIRQTIRDPFEQIQVRIFNQRSATPVMIITDLSASMNFGSQKTKLEHASEIASVITNSVVAKSDAIGFIGIEDNINPQWVARLSYKPYKTQNLINRLSNYQAKKGGHRGIKSVYQFLPKDKTLIFFISDFHIPIKDIKEGFSLLNRHQVVPIVLWNKSEYENLPGFGILTVNDPESGEESTMLLRKNMNKRIQRNFNERKKLLEKTFIQLNSPAFFVGEEFKPLQMTEYFNEYLHA
jgi:uncharacterized protein (DUF58 family)